MSDLINEDGVEYPTHTTSHNQVVAVKIADPSPEVLDNYLALKNERGLDWDQVADLVTGQDPALADYLRAKGADHEKASAVSTVTEPPVVLTELAVNPLSTPDERAAALGGDPVDDAGAHAAPDTTIAPSPTASASASSSK